MKKMLNLALMLALLGSYPNTGCGELELEDESADFLVDDMDGQYPEDTLSEEKNTSFATFDQKDDNQDDEDDFFDYFDEQDGSMDDQDSGGDYSYSPEDDFEDEDIVE